MSESAVTVGVERRAACALFVVYGIAQPQGSKSGFVNPRTGRAILREGSSSQANRRFKSWRDAVENGARAWQMTHHAPLMEGPVELELWLYLPRPKSAPKRIFAPATRPDASKMLRSVEDSLTGIIWHDDSQVVDVRVHKRFAVDRAPCAIITVRAITSAEHLA